MKKPHAISLISLFFAVSTAACASAPAKAPEAPKPEGNDAELALLGIAPGGTTNQITPAPAAPATSSANAKKDDGSDIVPPFTSSKPSKAAPAKPAKAPAKSPKKTASR